MQRRARGPRGAQKFQTDELLEQRAGLYLLQKPRLAGLPGPRSKTDFCGPSAARKRFCTLRAIKLTRSFFAEFGALSILQTGWHYPVHLNAMMLSGGRVNSADAGWLWHLAIAAVTPPRFPTLLPP